jgi:hypothetical protein
MNISSLTITPHQIGQYSKHNQSKKYIKLENDKDNIKSERDWRESFKPLNPALSKEGYRFEEKIEEKFRNKSKKVIDNWKDPQKNQEENNNKIKSVIEEKFEDDVNEKPISLFQVNLSGTINEFFVPGDSDLFVVSKTKENEVDIKIIDIKASWEEKTHHQIQVASYSILLKKIIRKFKDFDIKVNISGGVIHKNTDIKEKISIDELPEFEIESREDDVKRMLSVENNLKDYLDMDLEDIEYNLDNLKMSNFGEYALVKSIEGKHLRLLGLSIAEQKAFRKVGLEDIEDVADLTIEVEKPRPYKYNQYNILDKHKNKVKKLRANGIEVDFVELAQKSQALLSKINPENPKAYDKPWKMYLSGSGESLLPEDSDNSYCDYNVNNLKRVFLNVQKDHIKDSIDLVSYIIEEKDQTIKNSNIIDDIYESESRQRKAERNLIIRFCKNLLEDVKSDKNLLHFYFYTKEERDEFVECLYRHKDNKKVRIILDIMGLREGIEQKMISVVQEDIRKRFATKQPLDGLIPIYNESYFGNSNHKKYQKHTDWKYKRENGKEINIRSAFYTQIFDYNLPIKLDNGSPEIILEEDSYGHNNYYPTLPRFKAEIPIEYIWGTKEIDKLDKTWTENQKWKNLIESFRWIDNDKKDRILKEDVKQLSIIYCELLLAVTDSIKYKNSNMKKEEIENKYLEKPLFDDKNTPETLKDYLKLEYIENYNSKKDHYMRSIENRILSGESIPVRVVSHNIENGFMEATCQLIYDEFDFENPNRIARSTKIKGSEGDSGGSRLVMSPIVKKGSNYNMKIDKKEIFNSPMVNVTKYDPDKNIIKIESYPNASSKQDSYESWHRSWSNKDKKELEYYEQKISEGYEFILDPCSDDMNKERCEKAINQEKRNKIFNILNELKENKKAITDIYKKKHTSSFVNWIENNADLNPNKKQKEFIKKSNSKISLLQGPPGTGKTSGALSLAILSRIYALNEENQKFNGLVSGASNKSINEVMEDVISWKKEIENKTEEDFFEGLEIFRITSNKPEDGGIDGVEYLNTYEDEEKIEELDDMVHSDQETLSGKRNILIFSTPSNIFNLTSSFKPSNKYKDGCIRNDFNLLAIDEASMMTIPQLILASSLFSENGQLLLSGDQRQMPPVQRKEWSEEKRRNILEKAPFLSTLDYFRYLRGDDIEKLDNIDSEYNINIPITKLNKTYRCHKKVANFLKKWIYQKDKIDYKSDQTDLIKSINYDNELIETLLNPNNNIVLLLHNDKTSQQNNINESIVCSEIIEKSPSSESIGVVTPHNSQKGLLKSLCNDEKAQIDTVERFQGGQKDIMILSSTVSDFNYIQKESEFILNPERLNVALSRMKKKLIVMAPRNIFNIIQDDVSKYNRSVIWKGLYKELNISEEEPDYKGNFKDISSKADDIKFEIYTK